MPDEKLIAQTDITAKPKRARKAKPAQVVEAVEESVSKIQSTNYTDPVQNMAYDVYRLYQEYWKTQHQALLQYWTTAIKNTYNPWNK